MLEGVRAGLDAHRLIHHTLLLRVVTHLNITKDREILAEGMPDKSVVGQNAAQIGVPREDDPEQIVRILDDAGYDALRQ